jgi:hypothetical protein
MDEKVRYLMANKKVSRRQKDIARLLREKISSVKKRFKKESNIVPRKTGR